ncbi:MAG: GAF domain-containing protein, partial [Chloroflexi bacterium]|nr:GAF domain-containing protein [Chloroflexota bacterium]
MEGLAEREAGAEPAAVQLDATLVRSLHNLNGLIPHQRSAIWLLDAPDTLRLAASRGLDQPEGQWSAPALVQAVQESTVVSLDEALLAGLPGSADWLAGMAVPLLQGGDLAGVLAVAGADAADVADVADVGPQLAAFADQVALLLGHTSTQQAREFAAFSDIAATLNQSLDLDDILHDALRHTLKAVGMEAGWVLLVDEAAGVARVAVTYGLSSDALVERPEISLQGVNLDDIAHQLDQAVVVNDPLRSPQLVRMVMRAQGLRAYVSIPLMSQDRLLGIINAFSYSDRYSGSNDVRLLTAIGRQVGVALENARLYESEAHRAEQLDVISKVAQAASSSLEAEQLMWRVVRLIQGALGYGYVGIALVEDDEVVVRAGVGEVDMAVPDGMRLKVGQGEIMAQVVALGEPVLKTAIPLAQGGPTGLTMAELAVPLRAQGRVIGVLDVRARVPASLGDDDRSVLSLLANQVGVALENARLYEDTRRQLSETTTLYRVSQAINSTMDLEDMLGRVIDECLEAMQAERGCVLLRRTDTGELAFQVGRDRQRVPITAPDVAFHQPTIERVMAEGTGTMAVAALGGGRQRRAILCVPLIIKGQTSGAIYVDNRLKAGQFSTEGRDLLMGVAGQVAIAIENAHLHAQVEELAVSRERNRIAQEIHDTLTQQLSSVIMRLDACDRLLDQDDLDRSRDQLQYGRDLSRTALQDL